jgi:hypothetical protein
MDEYLYNTSYYSCVITRYIFYLDRRTKMTTYHEKNNCEACKYVYYHDQIGVYECTKEDSDHFGHIFSLLHPACIFYEGKYENVDGKSGNNV